MSNDRTPLAPVTFRFESDSNIKQVRAFPPMSGGVCSLAAKDNFSVWSKMRLAFLLLLLFLCCPNHGQSTLDEALANISISSRKISLPNRKLVGTLPIRLKEFVQLEVH